MSSLSIGHLGNSCFSRDIALRFSMMKCPCLSCARAFPLARVCDGFRLKEEIVSERLSWPVLPRPSLAVTLVTMDRAQRTRAARTREPIEAQSVSSVELLLEEPDWEGEEADKIQPQQPRRKQAAGTRLDATMESAPAASTGATKVKSEPKSKTKVSSKTKDKKETRLEITGQYADFPVLGMTHSHDAVFNMSWVLHGRLAVHFQLVWLLRSRVAMESYELPWKRHPRWLAMMMSKEVAAIWGHLGGAVKTLSGPRGPQLLK